jgi:hypothetical protein
MPMLLEPSDCPYWFTLPSLLVFAHKNDGHKKAPVKRLRLDEDQVKNFTLTPLIPTKENTLLNSNQFTEHKALDDAKSIWLGLQ